MIKVLVVDDSAVVRKVLTNELSQFSDIDVVGSATDPYVARQKIALLRPDVITLDIEMPRMDGLTFLAKLMQNYPLPVVIVSSLAPENSQNALTALSLGAVDVIAKPGSQFSTPDVGGRLADAIRVAAKSKIVRTPDEAIRRSTIRMPSHIETTSKIIAIGASTGGTRAIEHILTQFPADAPGIVIVQHMPIGFTASFAERLNRICKIKVREARDRDTVSSGTALIAPGNIHMLLKRNGANYEVKLKAAPAINHHRPSVDVLFRSVAEAAGANAIGVILTGMGKDGARGMLAMREHGSFTIAQDEKSCVVFGMPKEAIEMGSVSKIVPLENVARETLVNLHASSRVVAA